MINDYTKLKDKYEKMLTLNELIHDISGGAQTYAMGLTTSEAYVGLVEQNIGQNIYQKYFKLEYAYQELFSVTERYISEKEKYNELIAQIKSLVGNIKSKEKDILEMEDERKKLIEKGNLSPAEEKKVEQLTKNLYKKKVELQEDIKKKQELDKTREELQELASAYLTRINKLKELVEKRLQEVYNLPTSFELFTDKEFEKNIEQDFIDACLLPGEENKEIDLRTIAKSKFLMMKLESILLERVKKYSENLLNSLEATSNCKELVDLELPNKVIAENKQAKGLDLMSTEFLGSSDMILNEKAIAEFYIHTYNQLVKTELGRNPNQEFANLPVVAIQQFKIPQKTLVGIKGQITQALNGYSTMFSIECLNPLFSGARDLQEAQLILQKVIKENGLKV